MAIIIKNANLKFRYPRRKRRTTTAIVIHHDNNHNLKNPRSIHAYHKNVRGWNGIGYNNVVYSDGDIYKGRGHEYTGAHCKYANSYSIGICISGDFHGSDAQIPTLQQMRSAAELIKYLLKKYPTIKTIKMHREMPRASTVCPGNKFPMQRLLDMVYEKTTPIEYTRALRLQSPYMRGADIKAVQNKLNALGFDCGVADGIFGKLTDAGVKRYQGHIYPHDGDVYKTLWDKLFKK